MEPVIFDGKHGSRIELPFVFKQNYKLDDLDFIGFDKVKTNDSNEEHFHKTVHFFLSDYKFEDTWNEPDREVERLKPFKQLLGPDFSTFGNMPRVLQMYNIFRARWVCAKWQQNGMLVIPTITWSGEASYEWCFAGIEKGSTVAISTVGTHYVEEKFLQSFKKMVDFIQPEKVINYGRLYDGMTEYADIINIEYKFMESDYHEYTVEELEKENEEEDEDF
jgi:hypothetical protein